MIKNTELYTFAEEEEENSHPEEAQVENGENPRNPFSGRLLMQTMIVFLSLTMVLLVGRVRQPWTDWIRSQIHQAVNASSEATFGHIWKYPALQNLIQSSRQWVRLESNNPLADSVPATNGTTTLPKASWPVNGRVTKEFGWGYNSDNHRKEFFQGVEITALPEAEVYALADGEIVEVIHRAEDGWGLTINHGNGWKSVYRHLAKVWVTTGQSVKSGATIAQLERNLPFIRVEVFHQERPVNPLTLLK
ncbi:peptidase M23-like protein [Hydrogenispora ethanolica]|jgi:murein DD-endopeptidase MepM/ murein hydrolase activator NlpD|uniref:Peptidase M23-like protein n=1 Tax=Hydrogenispora ethanolica TaxID=1082276 RepID=A0A4R1RF58_HYDET|nr:peptidoglycan DD-metalloendopeptidase family protein [Hydrogenispora ethanolica]TCL64202.1 peptidase M23-like protein [Hydrogenispora ethanolica]